MKNRQADAARWLRQARYDLEQAGLLLERGVYCYAAFLAEQAAQKALKAFLLSRGRRTPMIHSVAELARICAEYHPAFVELVEHGLRLDRHYLTSRYPDALPEPVIPADAYLEEDAVQALSSARAIVTEVSGRLPPG